MSTKSQFKIPPVILQALTGWLAGAVGSILMGVVWPIAFPAIVRLDHYYGVGPSVPSLVWLGFLISSPFTLVAGIVGGRLIREGGRTEQLVAAAILGLLVAIPFTGCSFWVFTGW